MMWDDQFWIMLLNHDFYGKFIQEKQIIDAQTTSGALISFSLESAEAVKQFGETAKANGGNCYRVDMGIPEEQMYGLEVQDLDGNSLEPVWMKIKSRKISTDFAALSYKNYCKLLALVASTP